jgi:excinuclease ABC subunit C
MSALEHLSPALRDVLDRLPRESGVYLLKEGNTIVYVGKAVNLFSRVRSYFTRSGDDRAFVPQLEHIVDDVETIVTRNEKEALLLENNLIKEHKPRFNVMLRDDKSYLVLRLDPKASYPRLEITRRIKDDGARYFGPYHSASDCRQTLRLVNRHFMLRTCSDRALAGRKRPCLQHQIGRCLAPCVFSVDIEQYSQQIHDVTLFLRGKGDELLRDLESRMREAADALDFECAARIRDQVAAVRNSLQGQQAVSDALLDQDVIGTYREGDRVDFVVLLVRQGKLVGRRPFSLSGQEFPDEELLSAFVSRYYDRGEVAPSEVLLPVSIEDVEAKRQWLSGLSGRPVEIHVPLRGKRRALLELARSNARSNFQTRRQHGLDLEEALRKLQQRLHLLHLPRRIECFDISGMQGELVVASMVVLQEGRPLPAGYRRFKIRSSKKDDFAAMYEVLSRRLRRGRDGRSGWELPELIVVDGGKAQLSMALAALKDLGLEDEAAAPDVVALAKERPGEEEQEPGPPDRVFLPHCKDAILLRPNTAELHLLSHIRDEAHRFAVTYHRQLRRRRTLRSGLEDISGIGPKRRRKLLSALGSVKRIREATVEDLAAVPGMTIRAAETVAAYFASSSRPSSAGAFESDEGNGPEKRPTSKD